MLPPADSLVDNKRLPLVLEVAGFFAEVVAAAACVVEETVEAGKGIYDKLSVIKFHLPKGSFKNYVYSNGGDH